VAPGGFAGKKQWKIIMLGADLPAHGACGTYYLDAT
jgi:hypothetical protein